MPQQNVIISGRKINGIINAIKTDDNGALDVFVQDQHTPFNSFYVKQLLNLVTLADNVTLNTRIINLTAGHNFTAGDYLSLIENSIPYQGKVLNVNVNQITVDTPFCCPFTTSAIAARTSIQMNVNGSVTPVTFNINPIQTAKWDITGFTFLIEDEVAMDTHTFGGITALTNGIVIRKKYVNGTYRNYFNIKSNGEFEINSGTVNYQDKAPSGLYGFTSKHKINGQENFGVVIRLDGSLGEEFQIVIQDDLSALTKFNAVIHLSEVLD